VSHNKKGYTASPNHRKWGYVGQCESYISTEGTPFE